MHRQLALKPLSEVPVEKILERSIDFVHRIERDFPGECDILKEALFRLRLMNVINDDLISENASLHLLFIELTKDRGRDHV